MDKIAFDVLNLRGFVGKSKIELYEEKVGTCHHMIYEGTGEGSESLGWVNLPYDYDPDEFERIKACGQRIRQDSDALLVIGVGGSYLGSRAAIDTLKGPMYNELSKDKRKGPKIYFLGHNLSASYIKDLIEVVDGGDISLNIISKSGTTLEPTLAFRILKDYMEKKYGKEEAARRIYATTDKNKGALKKLADREGYETFVVPDDIGGRYSVLTPVGLLPMAVAGIDIDQVMEGARAGCDNLKGESMKDNPAYSYAVARNALGDMDKSIEVLVTYQENLFYLSEWFKQLFGESQGKDGKGIFPASLTYPTDLHSMGQYVQDGKKNLFQTILNVENQTRDMIIESCGDNLDGLNYLEGKSLNYINKKAMEGALEAHSSGGVPNLMINIPRMDEYYFGYLVYFFMKACAMSCYLQGLNPFDQPGVEAYKSNMFDLLGKFE